MVHLAPLAVLFTLFVSLSPSFAECPGDFNGDGFVTVDEILRTVNFALNGCPPNPTATATNLAAPTATPSPTATATWSSRFVDNEDGTVTDHETGLMWEKKAASNDPHDVSNLYRWAGKCGTSGALCQPSAAAVDACPAGSLGCAVCGPEAGTCRIDGPAAMTIFQWVAQLNSDNFAGYSDWRIPTREELQTILDLNRTHQPAAGEAFFTLMCYEACTSISDPECSCTFSSNYWTSTSFAMGNPNGLMGNAWIVEFDTGYVVATDKNNAGYIRAVRQY